MNLVLAVEGGYQVFTLGSSEWFWLVFSTLTAVLAILVGLFLMRGVLASETGTPTMVEIALAIQEGAMAYLRRQFKTIAVILIPLAIIVFATATEVAKPGPVAFHQVGLNPSDGSAGLSFAASGLFRTLAFIGGCFMSGLTGFIGMSLAVRGNVRTAAAAKAGSLPAALKVAFRTGGVAGMFTVGLGLFGATVIIMIFQNTASAILIGFGFGGSLLALFLRVGGGIFTKAADVGADLVGKVEAGIPEDDPRNPATIADNVGDNVGDCAGMAADLFESYEVTLVASIILGVAAFKSIGMNPTLGIIFPLAARAIGVLASILGVFAVRATDNDKSAMAPINRGFLTAGILTVVGTAIVAFGYVGNDKANAGWKCFGAVVAGLILAQGLSRLTEYFTSTETAPVREIAEASRTGPATVVLSGISSGLESSVYAIIGIAIALGVAIAMGDNNIQFTFYLVALTGMGMLATTGVVVSEDTFGPVADNAAGIAEMSGEFEGEPERIMVSLDAVGNTTKAVTKGFAIGSAVIASVALFASFVETAGNELGLKNRAGALLSGNALFNSLRTQINVADPKTFIGLLIGGSVAFLFSALAIRAVGRTAGVVVQEVRSQFADGGIMAGTKKPDYGPVIDICTAASLRELATPALLAVLTPVIIGFGINFYALGAFLAGVILTGQLMANFLSNSGGAWDNAKKYIEDGNEGGKGSESHKAAVIGDTVGDPFKDTAGPALNPLIKVMNLVSLLILPAVISLRHDDLRFVIAGAALVVLIGAVAFSKRKGGAFAEESEDFAEAEAETGVTGPGYQLTGVAVEDRPSPVAYAIGGLLPIAVGAAMVGVRGEIDHTNIALVLVLVVVATAAFGGRGPAALSAVIAALSFEFFFTKPYLSLRINSADDVETTFILLAIGLAVGQLAVHARRTRQVASRGQDEITSMRRMAERVAAGASDQELIELAGVELMQLLSLVGCRFEVEATGPVLPLLERSGRVEAPYRRVGPDGELALPPLGVRLPVVGGGRQVGSLVLDPDPDVGVSVEARLVAVALADQLGAALAHDRDVR